MNIKEYNQYQADVAAFFDREGINNLSAVADDEGNIDPYFSWQPCECCGSRLGGDRYEANGYIPATGEASGLFSVCPDCIYYAEYGQLDDMTMLEIDSTQTAIEV